MFFEMQAERIYLRQSNHIGLDLDGPTNDSWK